MTKARILSKLRSEAAVLQRLGARHLYLFGSAARDEANPSSDVDLFFDYDTPGFSLLEMLALQERLSSLLGAPVDLMSRGGIHPRLRPSIESSAIKVF